MNKKMKVLARFWAYTFGISLVTVMVYHLVPRFGGLVGDLEINCEGLRVPLVSCGLLALVVVGLWAWRNWKSL